MRIIRQSRAELLEKVKTKKAVLFGTGTVALRFLNLFPIADKISYVCDNYPGGLEARMFGLPVVSPDILKTLSPEDTVVIVAAAAAQVEMAEQAAEYGDFDIYFARTLVDDIFERVACELFDHRDEVDSIAQALEDGTSKHIYREIIRRRMLYGTGDFSDLQIPGDMEYIFPPMYARRAPSEKIIIDCGAYMGDTMEKFFKMFGPRISKMWIFECGKPQQARIEERIAGLKELPQCPEIIMMPYGVSDKREKLPFFETQKLSGSFIPTAREFAKDVLYEKNISQIETVSLDEIIPEDEKVTLIKMDIEGSEYNALRGAAKLIRRHRPGLAISIYHSGEDFFRLPQLIRELVPEYHLAVRHYHKSHNETDLYAWV